MELFSSLSLPAPERCPFVTDFKTAKTVFTQSLKAFETGTIHALLCSMLLMSCIANRVLCGFVLCCVLRVA